MVAECPVILRIHSIQSIVKQSVDKILLMQLMLLLMILHMEETGNVNAGEAYWSGVGQNTYVDENGKAATVAAYTFLKTLASNVAQNLLINPHTQVAS